MRVFLKERVFYPIKYGADPAGERDSSDAILKALSYAFQVQNELELLPGINDLAGVVIDLQGGNYKISKPIRFPAGGGNPGEYPVLFILIHKQRYFTYRSSFLECT